MAYDHTVRRFILKLLLYRMYIIIKGIRINLQLPDLNVLLFSNMM